MRGDKCDGMEKCGEGTNKNDANIHTYIYIDIHTPMHMEAYAPAYTCIYSTRVCVRAYQDTRTCMHIHSCTDIIRAQVKVHADINRYKMYRSH